MIATLLAPGQLATRWPLRTPLSFIESASEGYFAARPDDSVPFVFIRISRPTYGKRKGCLAVQTQHSDTLKPWVTFYPNGRVQIFDRDERYQVGLMIACADATGTAMAYGHHIGKCGCCGKKLTDDRSRYFGIGPECEKKYPKFCGPIIARVTEEQGDYYHGKVWC